MNSIISFKKEADVFSRVVWLKLYEAIRPKERHISPYQGHKSNSYKDCLWFVDYIIRGILYYIDLN